MDCINSRLCVFFGWHLLVVEAGLSFTDLVFHTAGSAGRTHQGGKARGGRREGGGGGGGGGGGREIGSGGGGRREGGGGGGGGGGKPGGRREPGGENGTPTVALDIPGLHQDLPKSEVYSHIIIMC